jgi:hypothetical protein
MKLNDRHLFGPSTMVVMGAGEGDSASGRFRFDAITFFAQYGSSFPLDVRKFSQEIQS